jgi:exodeoxyribonuclease VII small subunit
MVMQDTEKNINDLSFEQAMSELEQIVRRLENGDISLNDSIKTYMRGTQLKNHCQKTLDEAKLQVEKIIKGEDGLITTANLD